MGLPDWALDHCSACSNEKTELHCFGYDEYNLCGRWWYSERLDAAFNLGGRFDEDPSGKMSSIMRKGWATGASLFDNAA